MACDSDSEAILNQMRRLGVLVLNYYHMSCQFTWASSRDDLIEYISMSHANFATRDDGDFGYGRQTSFPQAAHDVNYITYIRSLRAYRTTTSLASCCHPGRHSTLQAGAINKGRCQTDSYHTRNCHPQILAW